MLGLQTLTSRPGKVKSQRERQDLPIKKFVLWPQHYLLVEKDKLRLTYDQLKQVQWVSCCIKAALDLPELDTNFAL